MVLACYPSHAHAAALGETDDGLPDQERLLRTPLPARNYSPGCAPAPPPVAAEALRDAALAEHTAYSGPEAISVLAGLVPITAPRVNTRRRELPLGLQQVPARGDHHHRRQLPPCQPWASTSTAAQQPYGPTHHGVATQLLNLPTAA